LSDAIPTQEEQERSEAPPGEAVSSGSESDPGTQERSEAPPGEAVPSGSESDPGTQLEAERALAETDEPAAAEMARADADEIGAPPTDEVADEGPQLDPSVLPLLERLEAELGDAILDRAEAFGTLVVRVRPDAWRRSAEVAKSKLSCDYLSFISGIDWQPAPREGSEAGGDTSAPVQPTETTFGLAGSDGRFQVFAYVQSTAHHWGVTFKADIDEADPRADSWVPVYAGADWHERECWEMYGFVFDGHPALRHLYLPSEFEGHPLRKDFPLLARAVKPWPGLVDVEPMPGESAEEETADAEGGE
jgi:NADH-quinone oxidoreductase subunit C